MEFFREKNNKYFAESISGNPSARYMLRFGILVVTAGVFAFVLFLSPMKNDIQNKTPLVIGMVAFIFANMVGIWLARAGYGSGVIVDQMNRTVSYRKPGGNRHTVDLGNIKGIIISKLPNRASILCLEKTVGGRHIVTYCSDTIKLRMFAGELSTLTSLTVTEENERRRFNNA